MNIRKLFLQIVLVLFIGGSVYGISTASRDEDDDSEQEDSISLKEVPDAVQSTVLAEILREVDGLEIEEIEREKEGRKVVYEIELEYKGKDIELEIADNGKLLRKEVEREEDDDDDENENEDDEDEEDEDE
jgi:hypothetical protein